MKKAQRHSLYNLSSSHRKKIKYRSDIQFRWDLLIPQLKNYKLEKVEFLSVPGEAPKDFITAKEHTPGKISRQESYIAKVGAKSYPNESIVEQFITRIGQSYGLNIADSKLRLIDGQVRFMSKYFLKRSSQQLTHGAELFEIIFGKEDYGKLAQTKKEHEILSFQMVCEAVRESFPEYENKIVGGFVEMLTFDALIGHNDRHPYNWGVVVPVRKAEAPRFSPIFDTARALFWNQSERKINQMLTDKQQLENYIKKCTTAVCWDREKDVDYFRLTALIWKEYDVYRPNIERFFPEEYLKNTLKVLDNEFGELMSKARMELIARCLRLRRKRLIDAIAQIKGGD
jgi:hypothetical protein